jgi:hypothetical protein
MADRGIPSESSRESSNEPDSPRSPQPRRAAPAAGLVRPARGFVRFLYSSNPFYILSADLVFVGLKISFGSGGPASQTWALLFGLAGYTLLMAATACYLIRAGKLWDDLRSLLILIVMMFMTMAMSGDDTLAANPAKGALGCLGGLLFAVIVSESILWIIRLRLPGWYRAAYYLILVLMFVYPLLLVPLSNDPESPRMQWALFGFAALSGLVLLSLVPAARGGPAYVAKNGSPWRWPLFPWSLFLIMAGGLAVRSYSLCVSFHYIGGSQTLFGPYFLVPIGLAVSLVWLEIAIASGRRGVMITASALPLILVWLALDGHRYEVIYEHFLDTFMTTLGGSPAFLTLIAAAIFYLYALSRRAPAACEFLCVVLVGLAMVGPRTVRYHEIAGLEPLPLLAAGSLMGLLAWRRHSGSRAATAALLLVLGLTATCEQIWPRAPLVPIFIHLIILSLLVVAAGFDSWLRELARTAGPIAIAALGVGAVLHSPKVEPFVPVAILNWYPLLAIAIAATYGLLLRQPLFTTSAVVTLATWVVDSGAHAYQQLRRMLTGLDELTAGIILFLIALAISLKKAGLGPRLRTRPLSNRLLAGDRAVAVESFWEADETERGGPTGSDSATDGDHGADLRQSDP